MKHIEFSVSCAGALSYWQKLWFSTRSILFNAVTHLELTMVGHKHDAASHW